MGNKSQFRIAVSPGDGIGHEVIRTAAEHIRRAVNSALRIARPLEIGGDAGAMAITRAVLDAINSLPLENADAA
jgi:isocitrate/isopropylmalate dehydrogenase